MWNATNRQAVGESMRWHYGSVRYVPFRVDGSHVLSGSADKTVHHRHSTTEQAVAQPILVHEAEELKSVDIEREKRS